MFKKVSKKVISKALSIINVVMSISGFVPQHMTLFRSFIMFGSVLATTFLLPMCRSMNYAIIYFAFSAILYTGFVFLVLPERGYRLKMIKKFGEQRAYLKYEAFLAFAFFHNGVVLSFISYTSADSSFYENIPVNVTMIIAAVLFIIGLSVKIWSAYVVGVPIYYWKDLFLGRRICDFVVSGPYKYLANPMYGIGQVQGYAIAIYYHSIYGIIFGAVNQGLVFLFYFLVEKPFIYRTYLQNKIQSEPNNLVK